jgi:hypothetical protein
MDRRAAVVYLLRTHPGWSDRKIARELASAGISVGHVTVSRWRIAEGLAPGRWLRKSDPRRRSQGVLLECGHVTHARGVKPVRIENGQAVWPSGWSFACHACPRPPGENERDPEGRLRPARPARRPAVVWDGEKQERRFYKLEDGTITSRRAKGATRPRRRPPAVVKLPDGRYVWPR